MFIGPPGIGETTLVIGLGLKALASHDALLEWSAALLIDELGYLPMAGEAAAPLFQVITRRYQGASIVLTTNRDITGWGQIFEDTTVAAAPLNRVLHHASVVQINGPSYRMRHHQACLDQLRAGLK